MTKPITWRTKDGRELRVAEMEDAHLLNTINFLRRRAVPRALALAFSAGHYAATAPDGAAMAAERAEEELFNLVDEGPDAVLEQLEPAFPMMLREATKRGLFSEVRRAND